MNIQVVTARSNRHAPGPMFGVYVIVAECRKGRCAIRNQEVPYSMGNPGETAELSHSQIYFGLGYHGIKIYYTLHVKSKKKQTNKNSKYKNNWRSLMYSIASSARLAKPILHLTVIYY